MKERNSYFIKETDQNESLSNKNSFVCTSNPSITFKTIKSLSCSKAFEIGFRFEIFNKHSNHIFSRVNKSIGLLRTFQPVLPRSSFFTIYKAFIRNHFDYADVIHDQSYKSSFHKKLESIRNNATLAPTGAVRGSSSEKLYQELGLKSPQNR